jgi:hypothetical protein
MADERFIGRVYNYNPVNNTIVLKADFIDIEQQEILQALATDQNIFTFSFKKPYKESKKYHQLKHYFSMLKKILIALEIEPDSTNMRAIDESIKKTCLKCETIDIDGQIIPLIPSKAEMDFETMELLNKTVEERYENFLGKTVGE